MNNLKLTQAVKDRFAAYKRAIPVYWQDQAMALIQRQNLLAGKIAPGQIVLTGKVTAVLIHVASGERILIPGLNIVTNDGDKYYAQASAGETPDDDFPGGGIRLGTDNTTPTKSDTDVTTFASGTGKAISATYPQTADADVDNTGAGVDVVTWLYEYTIAQGNATGLQEGAVVDNTTTPTAALSHFLFAASFDKTASDTLKIFLNHTMNGA